MSENLFIALIGLGGVLIGTILGWFLSIFWDSYKHRKERELQALAQLQKTLVSIAETLEKNHSRDYREYAPFMFQAYRDLNFALIKVKDRKLRKEIAEILSDDLGPYEARDIEAKVLEAIRRINEIS